MNQKPLGTMRVHEPYYEMERMAVDIAEKTAGVVAWTNKRFDDGEPVITVDFFAGDVVQIDYNGRLGRWTVSMPIELMDYGTEWDIAEWCAKAIDGLATETGSYRPQVVSSTWE